MYDFPNLNAVRHCTRFFFLLRAEAEHVEQQPLGLPRLDVAQLLREALLIGGGGKRLFPQDRGRLVVAVPVARRARESQDHHVGAKAADHPDYIGKYFVAPPLAEALIGRFRKAEIDGACEKLLCAIDMAGSQQFLCPYDTEQIALLGADQVLAALAAR